GELRAKGRGACTCGSPLGPPAGHATLSGAGDGGRAARCRRGLDLSGGCSPTTAATGTTGCRGEEA
ncbi:MAG: hypothetical protein AAFQ88_11645, partial [Pseudomonadota bacterium]